MRRIAWAFILAWAAAGTCAAELPLVPGARVRLSSPSSASGTIIGRFAGLEPGAVSLEQEFGETAVKVPLDADTKLEVSLGRKSQAGRGAMLGAAIGAAPGFLLTFGDYNDTGDAPSAMVVAAMGAAGGALLGAAVGWALKAEQWREVEIPRAGVAIVPLRHGVAASVRIAWGGRR